MDEGKAGMTKFKRWCIDNRMRAADIAEAIGCSPKTIYAYMQGSRLPSRRMERLMREKLGIETKEIFD